MSDGRLLIQVNLDLPSWNYVPIVIGNDQKESCDHPIVAVGLFGAPRNGAQGDFAMRVFDGQTGERLTKELLGFNASIEFSARADRLVVPVDSQLLLFDASRKQIRKLDLSGVTSARISVNMKYVVIIQESVLQILDWDSGSILAQQQLTGKKHKMQLARDGSILILRTDPAMAISRWNWTGSQITLITPETAIPEIKDRRLGFRQDITGRVQVAKEAHVDWPKPYRAICHWLANIGISVKKWLDIDGLFTWCVLNDQFEVLFEYEESARRSNGLYLNKQLLVEYGDPRFGEGMINVTRYAHAWPNALAMGVVVYLLIYVLARCLGHRFSGP
jgi:hypothetical protein